MDTENPFDRKLDANKRMPIGYREAFIDVTDTLDFCWAAARAVFGKAAVPEHALTLLPTFLDRAAAERQRQLAELQTRTPGEATPPAAPKRSRRKG
jgi:hypothetical protein